LLKENPVFVRTFPFEVTPLHYSFHYTSIQVSYFAMLHTQANLKHLIVITNAAHHVFRLLFSVFPHFVFLRSKHPLLPLEWILTFSLERETSLSSSKQNV